MKKNFFKKLSFVLALAMIVSVIAPAAGAFAATAPKLNSKSKYLHLDKDGYNEFDFNITGKKEGWSYKWTSANKAVVTVDKKGLTIATGIGATEVSVVIKDKDGEEVDTLVADVTVRDNIAELTELYLQGTEQTALDKLAVGKDYDFGRKFKTVSGSTTKTSGITRWSVSGTTATISDAGVFNATESGEYKITARSFQSVAKYTAWKADNTLDVVTATKELTVKVVAAITAVKLLTAKKLQLTFDSSVKALVDGKEDVTVALKLNDTYTAMVPVYTFDSISADGKVVTVSTYDALVNEKTYKVSAAGASFELYAQIGSPVSISMADQTIPANTASAVAYELLDQFGVNVSDSFNNLVVKNSSVPFDGNGKLTLADKEVAFVEFNYTIINADGTTKSLTTGQKTVTGAAATLGAAVEWNIDDAAGDHFATADKSIAVEEGSKFIYGRVKNSDGDYVTNYTFTSLNESILMINVFDNSLIPLTVGTALVKVTDSNNVVVAYITVDVAAKAATASVKATPNVVKLSNNIFNATPSTLESATVEILNVDQYGNETHAGIDTNVNKTYVANTNKSTDIADISVVGNEITFTARAGKEGSFAYFVTTSEGKTLTVSVTVEAPEALNSYTINNDNDALDAYDADNVDTDYTANFTVYGVDARGFKKQVVVTGSPLSASGSAVTVSYVVTGPNDFEETLTDDNLDGTVTFDAYDVTRALALADQVPTGTLTLTVTIGGIKFAKTFTVANTRPLPSLTIASTKATIAANSSVLAAVQEMIKLTYNKASVTITDVEFLSGNSGLVSDNSAIPGDLVAAGTVTIYVKNVTFDATGISQEMTINQAFTITAE